MNKVLKTGIIISASSVLLMFVGLGFLTFLLFPVGMILILVGALMPSGPTADPFGAGFAHAQKAGNTAIAVDPVGRRIKLKEGRSVKEYDLKDVRGWRTNRQSGGTTVHGGMAGFMHNVNAAAENTRASGIFVSVRDIDFPEWRIKLYDRKSQARWMEILDQAVNESGA